MSVRNLIFAAAGNAAPAGYQISRSLRFNSADSAYLNRTPASAGNRKTWTFSFWVKRSVLSVGQEMFVAYSDANNATILSFEAGETLLLYTITSGTDYGFRTTALFRDVSAWYHIVFVYDSTDATTNDRGKIYVNGVQQAGSWIFGNIPSNHDSFVNATVSHNIGRRQTGVLPFNGYLAEVHHVDGQALTPSDFGETDATTGVWKPKAYTGTYGTNGFYLNFSDNTSTTTLGEDQAGSNDWTLNNFSVTAGAGNDSLVDTPTPYGTDTGAGGEVRGNYATWNPLINGDSAANGNLNVTNDTARSTQALLQFDTYWEITSTGGTTTAGTVSATGTTNTTTIADTKTYGFRLTTAGTLDYINITDGGSFTNITTGLTGQQFIYASAASATTGSLNTGQRPFAATAPSGFKALCTQNLPTPTVVQGDDYFNVILWNGNNETAQSITGVGFQPDFVWSKVRNSADLSHRLIDAVRGPSKQLFSNATNAEATDAQGMTSFDSDGFSVGTSTALNYQTRPFVGWCWYVGGSNATNTDGTITSTVRANTTAGFSIVSYTGTGSAATVGHGLGAAPAMIIVKNRDAADAWQIYHKANTSAPETDYLVLNTSAATADAADRWNDTAPTSTVFSIGNGVEVNTNTEDYIAYVFVELEGYSKFGSYTGNGSTDGAFVYCGFKPAFVILKSSSGISNWGVFDNKRDIDNVVSARIAPNLPDAESSAANLDFVSNGFKMRENTITFNGSGTTYIFMAFAENPFKYSLAR